MDQLILFANTVAGLFLILFLPGMMLSLVIFGGKKIGVIDRICMSFALSIAIVPLSLFYSTTLGIPVTKVAIAYQATVLTSVLGVAILVRHLFAGK